MRSDQSKVKLKWENSNYTTLDAPTLPWNITFDLENGFFLSESITIKPIPIHITLFNCNKHSAKCFETTHISQLLYYLCRPYSIFPYTLLQIYCVHHGHILFFEMIILRNPPSIGAAMGNTWLVVQFRVRFSVTPWIISPAIPVVRKSPRSRLNGSTENDMPLHVLWWERRL